MYNPYPKLYLLSLAEAGDANLLVANGIELVILCHQGMVWPHSKTIGVFGVNIEQDGTSPDWVVKGMAKMLVAWHSVKTIGLADRSGGLTQAAFLLTCAGAEKLAGKWITIEASLCTKLPPIPGQGRPHLITPELEAQGKTLWA